MSARRRGPQKLISHRGSQDHHRLTDVGDERLCGALSEDDPIYGLNVIIIVRSMQRQMLIGQQPQMGVRHRRRMPVVRIAAMHVGERRLSEAQKQRKGGRDCRQSFQDSLQCTFPASGWSTRSSPGSPGRRANGRRTVNVLPLPG